MDYSRRPPPAAMLGILLFTGAVFVYVLFLLIYGVAKNAQANDWIAVDGRVLKIVKEDRSASVVYAYEYNDRRFRSDRLTFLARGSIPEKNHILDHYHAGMEVQVRVNPDAPEEAVLEVRHLDFPVFRNNLMILCVLGVFMGLVYRSYRHCPSRKLNPLN